MAVGFWQFSILDEQLVTVSAIVEYVSLDLRILERVITLSQLC